MVAIEILQDLLRRADGLLEAKAKRDRDLELAIITAIAAVAFPDANPRLKRHQEIDSWNPRILRLVTGRKFRFVTPTQRPELESELCFGPSVGCTMVFPLTENAFDQFISTNMAPGDINQAHLILGKGEQTIATSLYIGGIIHLFSIGLNKTIDLRAIRTMEEMLFHIADFLPRLHWRNDRLETDDRSNRPLPRLCCIVDQTGISEDLVKEYGFINHGTDRNGDRKYSIDLGTINRDESIAPELRTSKRIRELINTYIYFFQNATGRRQKRP